MARVDYAGVPTAAPDLEAPNDYQHIEASPASFGAALGQGAEALGQAGLGLVKFYGQVAADDATNSTISQATAVLRGDPNKMVPGPDGKPVPDTGYFGMRGADAMNARAQTAQDLDEIIRENRTTLSTPEAQHQYDTETRRYRAQWANEMGEHYDRQFQQWAVNTNDTGIALTQNQIAAHLNDPGALAADQQTLRQFSVKKAQAQYGSSDPQVIQGAVLKADQDFYLTQIRAAIGTDPSKAQEVLDKSGSTLASLPTYDGIVRQVKEAVFQQKMGPAVDGFVTSAVASAKISVQQAAAASAPPPSAASGPVYDQIAQAAVAHGASPDDVAFLKREAQLESHGDPGAQNGQSTGLFQFHPATFARLGGTDIHDTPQQVVAALQLKTENAAALTAAGVAPSGANLYLMHQQGGAGGLALLKAPAGESAVAALTPTYMATAGNDPAKAAAIATQAITHNGGRADMTAQDFVGLWTKKWGGQAGGGAAAYPTVTDALNANMADNLDRARVQAETLFPNYPDEQDRYVQTVERRLNQTVEQQKRGYEVDAHIVQSAMSGTNPPISEDQLIAISPQVAQAWNALQFTNPYARASIENRFNANARGKALTYGSNFKDYFDRAMAPSGDPSRISDPTQLNAYVGPGEEAPLTNTGSDQLTALMALRNTPQGEAFAAQAKAFVDRMHAELTFSDPSAQTFDPKGEQAFSKAMAQVTPKLMDAYKAGNLDKLLNPKDPDYLGHVAATFARPPAQIMKDRVYRKDTPGYLQETTGNAVTQGQFLLREAVEQGRLSKAEAIAIGEERGWFARPGPAVAPHLSAPPPGHQRPLIP